MPLKVKLPVAASLIDREISLSEVTMAKVKKDIAKIRNPIGWFNSHPSQLNTIF
jgi:hypothetical protein